MAKRRKKAEFAKKLLPTAPRAHSGLMTGISALLDQARRSAARTVNGILAATYWEIGRRIVEFEQGGQQRAEYGERLVSRLAIDLSARYGRGFSERNLWNMKDFYLGWEILQTLSAELDVPHTRLGGTAASDEICQTLSGKLEARVRLPAELLDGKGAKFQTPSGILPIVQTPSAEFGAELAAAFPLSWSHYVRLMSVEKPQARAFYESEAIRGGWSVRQLDRQISTQFFERTAHSKQQAAMLARGQKPKPEDAVSVEDEIRDPYLLEFLNLKDEYSESELEDALIEHLETFLLEMGAGFTFVARQKRIRIGTEWYRIDLLLFHRRLKCLVVIDLKIGRFTHADAGQMSLYLTYAKEHLAEPDENEPVGIILCSDKDDAVVHYSMGHMPAKVFASRYLTDLPEPETLRREILETKHALETRAARRRNTVTRGHLGVSHDDRTPPTAKNRKQPQAEPQAEERK
jgi:predicted nuclease of restriction endonuclease-like (RecB) superfamily